jgi:DNA mismatch repair ATPase MutL
MTFLRMGRCAQDLKMPGGQVDVNLDPTRREVGFLHQNIEITHF